jgi:UDP-glucose 4-epimerase
MEQATTCLITGAAGFIASHLVDRLLASGSKVIGLDNLLLGRRENLQRALPSSDFTFLEADVNDYETNLVRLRELLGAGRIGRIWHLAANSDIRAGSADPQVDLRHTFLTTFHVLGLARALGVREVAFASTSAVYGELPGRLVEDSGPWEPLSNYGAMKLASEALLSAAREQVLDRVWVFRFPNVVGPRATHGVIYDFLKKLRDNPGELEVLGDGRQQKPYLHVTELVEAMMFITEKVTGPYNTFNIGPDGTSTTVRFIAETVTAAVSPSAAIRYTGGTRGWPGDVPRFNYCIQKLKSLGWSPRLTSDQAVERAVRELASGTSG